MKQYIELSVDRGAQVIIVPDGYEPCWTCRASGRQVDGEICTECSGTGYVENVYVWGNCIECGIKTNAKAHGYYMCPSCESGEQEPQTWNDPARYDKSLLDLIEAEGGES